MMEKGRKRDRPGGVDGKPASKKQQRKAAMAAKTPYFTPKPSSSIAGIDVPLERLMPQKRIELIAELSESILDTSEIQSRKKAIDKICVEAIRISIGKE